MCFYDQHLFACGDWKWGHFRQHCTREYRVGETCGMKLVMATYRNPNKCKVCEKIDTKLRRRAKESDCIGRWEQEPGKFSASLAKAYDTIQGLNKEIRALQDERQRRAVAFS